MANKRDDFTDNTVQLLAKRAGWLCSNPDCRKPTIGANMDPNKWTNKGVAAHICAAAAGGPRYNAQMTAKERGAAANGIWLCADCSTVIDRDVTQYTVELLHKWKADAESESMERLRVNSASKAKNYDIALIRFYAQCLDRPAFQDSFFIEGCMENFDKALEDTITAINTGVLRNREGETLKVSEGKSSVQNVEWRTKLNLIARKISGLRSRLNKAKRAGEYTEYDNGEYVMYDFNDRELPDWFNRQRAEILELFSAICKDAGLPEIGFMCNTDRW